MVSQQSQSHLVSAPAHVFTNALMSLIFAETTTFGARTYRAQRRVLPREWVNVGTEFGEVRIKVSRVNGRILHVVPEFEDCKKLATEKNVPLQRVIAEAMRRYEGKSMRTTTNSDLRVRLRIDLNETPPKVLPMHHCRRDRYCGWDATY